MTAPIKQNLSSPSPALQTDEGYWTDGQVYAWITCAPEFWSLRRVSDDIATRHNTALRKAKAGLEKKESAVQVTQWTEEFVRKLAGSDHIYHNFKAIADAHNTSLKDESKDSARLDWLIRQCGHTHFPTKRKMIDFIYETNNFELSAREAIDSAMSSSPVKQTSEGEQKTCPDCGMRLSVMGRCYNSECLGFGLPGEQKEQELLEKAMQHPGVADYEAVFGIPDPPSDHVIAVLQNAFEFLDSLSSRIEDANQNECLCGSASGEFGCPWCAAHEKLFGEIDGMAARVENILLSSQAVSSPASGVSLPQTPSLSEHGSGKQDLGEPGADRATATELLEACKGLLLCIGSFANTGTFPAPEEPEIVKAQEVIRKATSALNG